MDPVLVSNGFEKIFPYHLSSDFSIVAEHDGKVLSYDENTGLMAIQYTWKEGKTTQTKNAVINLSSQISKNGGGGFFLSTKLKAYFKPGQKFKAKDVLAADDKFFDKYSDGVKFNIGTLCKVACISAYNTFEDSTVISTRLSHKMSSKITMEKHLVLGPNANVLKMPKIGDPISVNDSIIEYEQSNDDEAINKMLANIDDELKEGQRIVFPMHPPLHLMDMVPDPIVVAHYYLPVDEKKPPVGHYRLAHLLEEHAESIVGCRQHTRQRQLHVVVGSAPHVAASHARQGIGELYPPPLVYLQRRRVGESVVPFGRRLWSPAVGNYRNCREHSRIYVLDGHDSPFPYMFLACMISHSRKSCTILNRKHTIFFRKRIRTSNRGRLKSVSP